MREGRRNRQLIRPAPSANRAPVRSVQRSYACSEPFAPEEVSEPAAPAPRPFLVPPLRPYLRPPFFVVPLRPYLRGPFFVPPLRGPYLRVPFFVPPLRGPFLVAYFLVAVLLYVPLREPFFPVDFFPVDLRFVVALAIFEIGRASCGKECRLRWS